MNEKKRKLFIVCEGFDTPPLGAVKSDRRSAVLNPEANTLPKQHTPLLAAGLLIPFIAACLGLIPASCALNRAGEETLSLYSRAAGAYADGRFKESAELLSGAKNFPPALVLRGKALFFSDEVNAAEKSLRRALKLKPADAEALLYLARALREKGENAEAERALETALANNPQDLRALRLASAMAKEKGPSGEEEAAAYLDRAAEASSEAALVFLDRARNRWKNGNSPGALEDLRRAQALLPEGSPMTRPVLDLESAVKNTLPGNGD